MIHYLTESGSGNSELKNRRWILPNGVLNHLYKIKDENEDSNLTQNHTTKEAFDHLKDMIDWNTSKNGGRVHGITYQEMKRIKNWFDTNTKAVGSVQYQLYGGEIMKNWVNAQLTSATKLIKQRKEAEKLAGKSNAFNKEHTKDSTKVSKVDDKTPTYNPSTGEKQNKIKELTAMRESKTIILTEDQEKALSKLFINK